MPVGGARPGSGRKSKAEEMGLMRLLDKCWTKRQREECITALAEKAAGGEMEATKLLMAYTFGRPKERHEHSGPDGGALRIEVVYADGAVDPASPTSGAS